MTTRPRRFGVPGVVRAEWWPAGTLRLRFLDGAELVAAPEPTEEYAARAQALGYGTGPAASERCALEHDIIHVLLAHWLNAPDLSRSVPWLVAHRQLDEAPPWAVQGQEAMTLAVQKYANTGDPDPWLAPLWLVGVDLQALREHVTALFGTSESAKVKGSSHEHPPVHPH